MRVQSEQMWFCSNTWWVCFFKLFTRVLDGNLCSVRQMRPMAMLIVQPVFSLAIALHSWKTFSYGLRQQDTPFYGRWMSANFTAACGGFRAHDALPSAVWSQGQDLKERVLLSPQSHQGSPRSVAMSSKTRVKINRTDIFPCVFPMIHTAKESVGNPVNTEVAWCKERLARLWVWVKT